MTGLALAIALVSGCGGGDDGKGDDAVAATTTSGAERATRFALYGDSLSADTTAHLDQLASADGDDYLFRGFPGTAICDFLPAMEQDAREGTPDVVVLLFSGNSLTPCIEQRVGARRGIVAEDAPIDVDRFVAAYETDTVAAIGTFPAHTPIVLVGVPLTRGTSFAAARGLDDLYRSIADDRDNVHYLSPDRLLTPDGRYHDELPCETDEPCSPGQLVPVRAADGGHLCAPAPTFCFGGMRMATMIHNEVHTVVSAG